MNEQNPEVAKKNLKAKPKESWVSFFAAILAVLTVRWLLFEPYVIPSGSMIPTLLVHDHILVNKFAFGVRIPFTKKWLVKMDSPKKGDVVVFRSVEDDGYFMIKRVVATPGDTIEYTEDGKLLINGETQSHEGLGDQSAPEAQKPFYPVKEVDLQLPFSDVDFFKDKIGGKDFRSILFKDRFFSPRRTVSSYKIPEGRYFMMGDNRDNSKDSRYWGELPEENVIGRAMFVWLSCEDTVPFVPILCNPLTVRWKRFFHGIE